MPIKVYENAIERAAEKLGLAGQPRVVIFHEKANVAGVPRRHCHVVFSRIDPNEMKAINLPFYKERLCNLSRELFLEYEWDLPKGLADKSLADPLNFGLTEWQEAKRARCDAREIKSVLKSCWRHSDSANAFKAALESKGFFLCRGDRRGLVALDYRRNVFSLSRWLNLKGKDLQARLGAADQFQSVGEAQAEIAYRISASANRVMAEIEQRHLAGLRPLLEERERIRQRQRDERLEFERREAEVRATQARSQAQRLGLGLKWVWDWVTGRRRKLILQGKEEMALLEQRLSAERDARWKTQQNEIGRVHERIWRLQRTRDRERNDAERLIGEIAPEGLALLNPQNATKLHDSFRGLDLEYDLQ